MKKINYYFIQITLALTLNIFLSGCSTDDPKDSESIQKRTIITMESSVNSDIIWNDVELVWNEEFKESTMLDDIWVYETNGTSNPENADELQIYRKKRGIERGNINYLCERGGWGLYFCPIKW